MNLYEYQKQRRAEAARLGRRRAAETNQVMDQYPEWGTEDYRRYAILFNDITHSPVQRFIHLSDRQKIARYLWSQGWRREVRDEDITENKGMRARTIDGGVQRGEPDA